MNYTTITMKVPEGYEDHIRDVVLKRIEGILSYEINKPTPEKDAELVTAIEDAHSLNAVSEADIIKSP